MLAKKSSVYCLVLHVKVNVRGIKSLHLGWPGLVINSKPATRKFTGRLQDRMSQFLKSQVQLWKVYSVATNCQETSFSVAVLKRYPDHLRCESAKTTRHRHRESSVNNLTLSRYLDNQQCYHIRTFCSFNEGIYRSTAYRACVSRPRHRLEYRETLTCRRSENPSLTW